MNQAFDPGKKEQALRQESESWDTSAIHEARPGDIPVIDVGEYFQSGSDAARDEAARQVREACTHVGFYSLAGHQFDRQLMRDMFQQARAFHDLDESRKQALLMDRADWPVGGVGYMPFKNRKLPTRSRGNLNQAFIVKRDHVVTLADNQWPRESDLPRFRATVERYAEEIERLALRLLPLYAVALGLDADYFTPAFTRPLFRLRMTRYPPVTGDPAEYGIAPHVDTTFFTILAQDSPGLVIFSERRRCWIHAPLVEDAFIINTGELLKQWTNDRFVSVKHFANNNTGDAPRYSVPFFFNASADYPMQCLPTCHGPDNPPRYPAISYLESQAIAQGE